jgi:hypothetical protein
MVPILVRGPFSAPKFGPDLEGILTQKLEKTLPTAGDIEETLKKEMQLKTGDSKTPANEIKGVMQGIIKKE